MNSFIGIKKMVVVKSKISKSNFECPVHSHRMLLVHIVVTVSAISLVIPVQLCICIDVFTELVVLLN